MLFSNSKVKDTSFCIPAEVLDLLYPPEVTPELWIHPERMAGYISRTLGKRVSCDRQGKQLMNLDGYIQCSC